MKNEDFAAYNPRLDCSWELKVAIDSERASGLRSELAELVMVVNNAVEGFFNPTEATLAVLDFEGDPAVLDLFEPEPDEFDVIELVDQTGIESEKLKNILLGGENNIRYVGKIEMTGETNVYLKGGEYWLSKGSEKYRWWFREEAIERQPDVNLIDLILNHYPCLDGSDTYYKIIIWTYTDLWFEDTDIGRKNKERLRNVLNEIKDRSDVIDISYYSDILNDERLQEIVSPP